MKKNTKSKLQALFMALIMFMVVFAAAAAWLGSL